MTEDARTVEPQYQIEVDGFFEKGSVRLGPKASHGYRTDPRHFLIIAARYKFCSKLLSGHGSVLEVGSGDGFGSQFVLQEIEQLHGIDIDPTFVDWANDYAQREGQSASFSVLDIINESPARRFDAAYSLDLIEHIPAESENDFMRNICRALDEHGVFILGTPNTTASPYSSEGSKAGHINLKGADDLRQLMQAYFWNVFLFSMNDEVVHTGFYPMAHYLFAVGVGVRRLD